jgi:hypothetical protein
MEVITTTPDMEEEEVPTGSGGRRQGKQKNVR